MPPSRRASGPAADHAEWLETVYMHHFLPPLSPTASGLLSDASPRV